MSANTIPDDVMRAARKIMAASLVEFGGGLEGGAVLRCIIDAILAERQRCAALCEHFAQQWDNGRDDGRPNDGFNACMEAIDAILNPPSAASSRAEQTSEAVPPLASSPVTHSDWITWSGGKCPVSPETKVHFRTVYEMQSPATPIGEYRAGQPAESLRWSWIGNPFQDIAAYRVAANLTHEEAQ